MISLLKYVRGYLRIRVWGFSPERFMNLCSNKQILLWDIVRDGEVYCMNISLRNFYRLRAIARKTRTRVAICERYGLPFFVPTLLQRKVFVIGLFFAVGFWFWSSFFIWDIELRGNYRITEDIFNAFLKKNQVTVGTRKDTLNIAALEKEIRRSFSEITWTSAKLSGTKLVIDIKENDAPIIQETVEESGGYNLVSEYDGTIVSMIVRSGTPTVRIGDIVAKDTVLVDGKVPIYNDDGTVRAYNYVRGDGDIVLEHIRFFHDTLPFDYVKKEYTGRTSEKYLLRVGDKEWKIPREPSFLLYDSVIKSNRPLIFEKLSVPVYLVSISYREYQNVEYEYDLEEATALLSEKINGFIIELDEKGVQIIEKNVKIDTNGDGWTVDGEFLVREHVGRSVETVIPDMGEQVSNE